MITHLSLLTHPNPPKSARQLVLEVTWFRFLHWIRIWDLQAKLFTILLTGTQTVGTFILFSTFLNRKKVKLKKNPNCFLLKCYKQEATIGFFTLPIRNSVITLSSSKNKRQIKNYLKNWRKNSLSAILNDVIYPWGSKLAKQIIR